jgi:hypothetical protein
MFLMGEQPYWFEQYWYFGGDDGYDDSNECAVKLFANHEVVEDDDIKEHRRLISSLTFDEVCGLKETVDKVFENLLLRYNMESDSTSYLVKRYPWLKERADINPLFGSGEKQEEE